MSLFICPLCHSPLQPAPDTWRCDGSLNPKLTAHAFDVARQGYVNLLPVQQKKSKAPGDSSDSIAARQRFLAAGYYAPLQTLICEQIAPLLAKHTSNYEQDKPSESQPIRWLDVGCGEGYYTEAMTNLGSGLGMDTMIAADISKPAVVELARASKAVGQLWYQQDNNKKVQVSRSAVLYPVVASAAHLPLQPQSITGISSIFSPILPEVFATVLQDNGYLVIAKPDVGHLASIRQALFDNVREHDSDKFLSALAPYFKQIGTYKVSTPLDLPAEALADLLTMTPYAYRARREKRLELLAAAETQPLSTEAKFVLYVLQKQPPKKMS